MPLTQSVSAYCRSVSFVNANPDRKPIVAVVKRNDLQAYNCVADYRGIKGQTIYF